MHQLCEQTKQIVCRWRQERKLKVANNEISTELVQNSMRLLRMLQGGSSRTLHGSGTNTRAGVARTVLWVLELVVWLSHNLMYHLHILHLDTSWQSWQSGVVHGTSQLTTCADEQQSTYWVHFVCG